MNGRSRRTNGGFTLIELLVVMLIIGLLASLAFVALGGARGFFQGATAKARLNDVSTALELYKTKYGEYPPDCLATDAEIRRHILKRWPKALKEINSMVSAAIAAYDDPATLEIDEPGKALLFWIAGPDLDGFSADETKPFDINDATPRETPVMELAYDSDGSGGGNYNDDGLMFRGAPIAYFRAEKGGYEGKRYKAGAAGFAAPYAKNGSWYNSDSYQLILPGEDELFHDSEVHADQGHDDAEIRDLADSHTLTEADRDNVANFAEGATLDSEME